MIKKQNPIGVTLSGVAFQPPNHLCGNLCFCERETRRQISGNSDTIISISSRGRSARIVPTIVTRKLRALVNTSLGYRAVLADTISNEDLFWRAVWVGVRGRVG